MNLLSPEDQLRAERAFEIWWHDLGRPKFEAELAKRPCFFQQLATFYRDFVFIGPQPNRITWSTISDPTDWGPMWGERVGQGLRFIQQPEPVPGPPNRKARRAARAKGRRA